MRTKLNEVGVLSAYLSLLYFNNLYSITIITNKQIYINYIYLYSIIYNLYLISYFLFLISYTLYIYLFSIICILCIISYLYYLYNYTLLNKKKIYKCLLKMGLRPTLPTRFLGYQCISYQINKNLVYTQKNQYTTYTIFRLPVYFISN